MSDLLRLTDREWEIFGGLIDTFRYLTERLEQTEAERDQFRAERDEIAQDKRHR